MTDNLRQEIGVHTPSMITPEQLQRALAIFPELSMQSGALLESLAKTARRMRLEKGTQIFVPGDACQEYPLVLDGSIRVYQDDGQGRQITLYDVTPGELCVLSSAALMASSNYSAFAVAREDTNLIVLPPHTFALLLDQSHDWRRRVMGLFSTRLADLTDLVDAIAFRRLDIRLANLLLAPQSEIIAKTHQQLADELGSVRVIVTRLLGTFEARGWIDIDRGSVRITNRLALTEFQSKHNAV